MVRVNPWLDKKSAKSTAGVQTDRADSGVVTEVLPGGLVAVKLNGSTETDVVAPSDAGVTAVGATVQGIKDATGRIVRFSTPNTIPSGADATPVGVTGERLVQLDELSQDQQALIDQLDAASTELNEAMATLQEHLSDAEDSITGASQLAADAKEAAQSAIDSATKATTTANTAASDLLTLAGKTGQLIVQESAPTGTRADSKNLWVKASTGQPYQYNGSSWIVITDSRITGAANTANTAAESASLALTTANGKNTVFYQIATPANPKTGDRWFNSSSGLAQIWTGAVWRDTTPGEGFVPALDIGRATVGDMEVGRLKGGTSTWQQSAIQTLIGNQAFFDSIISNRAFIGDTTNLVEGSDFENLDRIPWPLDGGWLTNTGTVFSGTRSMSCSGSASSIVGPFPVTPGDEYTVSFMARASGSYDGTSMYNKFRVDDAANNFIAAIPFDKAALTPANTWLPISGSFTIPSGVTQVYFRMMAKFVSSSVLWIDNIAVKKKLGGELIVDGAVTASKITASAELWAKIATFAKVTTQMLTAGNVVITDSLMAKVIRGLQLIGKFATAESGNRVAIESSTITTGGTTQTIGVESFYSGLANETPATIQNSVDESGAVNASTGMASRSHSLRLTGGYINDGKMDSGQNSLTFLKYWARNGSGGITKYTGLALDTGIYRLDSDVSIVGGVATITCPTASEMLASGWPTILRSQQYAFAGEIRCMVYSSGGSENGLYRLTNESTNEWTFMQGNSGVRACNQTSDGYYKPTGGYGYRAAQVQLIDGIVHFTGGVRSSGAVARGSELKNFIPIGFRPPYRTIVLDSDRASTTGNESSVDSSGTLVWGPATTAAAQMFFSGQWPVQPLQVPQL